MKSRYKMKAWMMALGIMASALVRAQDSSHSHVHGAAGRRICDEK